MCAPAKKQTSHPSNSTTSPIIFIITSRDYASRFSASRKIKWRFWVYLSSYRPFYSLHVSISYQKQYRTKAVSHLYTKFILRLRISSKILHDQGVEFENRLFIQHASLLIIYAQHHTTHKQMVSQNTWPKHW